MREGAGVFMGHRRGRRGMHDKVGCSTFRTCDVAVAMLVWPTRGWAGPRWSGCVTPQNSKFWNVTRIYYFFKKILNRLKFSFR
jgi:hypothetical protein